MRMMLRCRCMACSSIHFCLPLAIASCCSGPLMHQAVWGCCRPSMAGQRQLKPAGASWLGSSWRSCIPGLLGWHRALRALLQVLAPILMSPCRRSTPLGSLKALAGLLQRQLQVRLETSPTPRLSPISTISSMSRYVAALKLEQGWQQRASHAHLVLVLMLMPALSRRQGARGEWEHSCSRARWRPRCS